jgi:hypothetical protein
MAIIAALATDFGWRLLPEGVGKVMRFVLATAASPPSNKSKGDQ